MDDNRKLSALNKVIRQCKKAPFYKDRLPEEPLRSLEELKKLPITTKEDTREHSPYGFISVPLKKIIQYHETFGTTGTPASAWLTKHDLADHAKRVNDSGLHLSKEDIVLIRFPYAISTIAHFTHGAAQSKNACVIPASSRTTVTPFTRVIDLMQKLQVTVLASLPMQALLIAETAEMMGLQPDKDFPHLRTILTAGEPMTPGKRKMLEDLWGVPISDNYGMTEIGPAVTDCIYGRAHPLDDYFIFEILDEKLEKEVPVGSLGYLVITTLTRQGTPLIRYLTGDLVRMIPSDCPCGKKWSIEIHGRKEYILTINGRDFDIWGLDEIVSHLPFHRFWVAGPMEGGLMFVVEAEKPGDQISPGLLNQLENKYQLKIHIEVVPKGTLYDRNQLMAVANVGKPRYIYREEELKQKAYVHSSKT